MVAGEENHTRSSKEGNVMDTLDTIDKVTDIVLLSLMLLQQISGKSKDEVLNAIRDEDGKTDDLIKKLR